MRTIAACLFLVLITSGCRAAGATSEPGESYRWTGELGSYDWLRIRNLAGSISVETTSGTEIEVVAEIRARRSDPGVQIVRTSGAGGMTFCAVWRGGKAMCAADGEYRPARAGRDDVQVHFRIRIPERTRVDLSTVNGQISFEGTAAALTARTTNGPIAVDLGRDAVADAIRLETTNGSIRVRARGTLDADVEAWAENGLIEVGGLTYQGRARIRLGTGGRTLVARTVNGPIRISRN
jgi:hypothetical protein